MRLVKKFEKDERTSAVSRVFDEVLVKNTFPLPFKQIELHIRDYDVTICEESKAIICLDYNNPLILEIDRKAIKTLLQHEFFRIMMRMNYPRIIEDVLVGKEMLKRDYGNDLFYMYYNHIMKVSHDESLLDYVKTNVPWAIFYGLDKYNSEFLKILATKLVKRKFPEAKKLIAILCRLSEKNIKGALKEYSFIFS